MKDYLIISESGCDVDADMMGDTPLIKVPITLRMQGRSYVDDGNLNFDQFLADMDACAETPKTSAPTPALYMKHFNKAKRIFIVTLSSQISSTYNNALLAKKLYHDLQPDKYIEVIDSKSASVGEALIARYLHKLLQSGLDPDLAVSRTRDYVNQLQTMFVIKNLSNLKKSGRLSHLAGIMASILNIKPILAADDTGKIKMLEKIHGYRRALDRMLEKIGENAETALNERVLAVAYCKAAEKARQFLNDARERYKFKECFLVEMQPTISVFANVGGILISY